MAQVVFWKMLNVKEESDKGEKVIKTVPVLRYYNVFHISQVEDIEPIAKAETFLTNSVDKVEKVIYNYISVRILNLKK